MKYFWISRDRSGIFTLTNSLKYRLYPKFFISAHKSIKYKIQKYMVKVYDATGQVLGRLASVIAKQLLNDEQVSVVYAERAIISGNKNATNAYFLAKADKKHQTGGKHKGPFVRRLPDRIVSHTIRGMLPFKKPHGREAFRRLKVYAGLPEGTDTSKVLVLEKSKKLGKLKKQTSVLAVSQRLGAKNLDVLKVIGENK